MSTQRNPVTITAPEGLPFVEIVREFEAPAALVFRAHEDPELVKHWLGPHGYTMEIDAWELRTGGRYRYEHTGDDGRYAFNGVFHAVVPDERITQTFEYEGEPGVVSIETATFEDLGSGRCRLTGHSTFPSVAARDGILAAGMEVGVREGFERLDDLLVARA